MAGDDSDGDDEVQQNVARPALSSGRSAGARLVRPTSSGPPSAGPPKAAATSAPLRPVTVPGGAKKVAKARKPSKAVVAAVAAAEGSKTSRAGRALRPSLRLSFD